MSRVFAEVVAVPVDAVSELRVGARFQLREETPVTIGRSARCRLRVDAPAGQNVCLGLVGGVATVWSEPGVPIPCSLSGRAIEGELGLTLRDGDHLIFPSGLVLALREKSVVSKRHEGLEAALAAHPDDAAALAVYVDFLTEHADPLGAWLVNERNTVEAERLRALGPLADSARSLALHCTWSPAGLLVAASLARHAVVGTPGLFWHLAELGKLPVARALSSLTIDYVIGAAPQGVVPPRGVTTWPRPPLLEHVVPAVVEALATAAFAPVLRHLSLGAATHELPGSDALLELARTRLPSLEDDGLFEVSTRATLEVVSMPEALVVFPHTVGSVVRLSGDARIGASAQCQVLLRGPRAPELACRVVRRDEGWVVLADEQATETGTSLVKVNGRPVSHAVLRVDDLLEPLPGLVFRFRLTLDDAGTRSA
ncbi:MAG: hypothetical protein Q8N26_10350 [Myxococcales bacterium]|nr:hypothetical protein [Myxococcales bacterium]